MIKDCSMCVYKDYKNNYPCTACIDHSIFTIRPSCSYCATKDDYPDCYLCEIYEDLSDTIHFIPSKRLLTDDERKLIE